MRRERELGIHTVHEHTCASLPPRTERLQCPHRHRLSTPFPVATPTPNYPPALPSRSWEPSGNLAGSHLLVQAYEARKHARSNAAQLPDTSDGGLCGGEGGEDPASASGARLVGGGSEGCGSLGAGSVGAGDGGATRRKLPRPAEQWLKVERVRPKPEGVPGAELSWLVSCAPPMLQQLVPNSRLRQEAPQLLLDFYEARLAFPKDT